MNQNLPVQNIPRSNFSNPVIAVTAILTVGVCYCVTITINAKYNRDTELAYKDFSMKSHSSVPSTDEPSNT